MNSGATPEALAALMASSVENGAAPVGTDALELFRIMIGVPKFGADIRETDLPQETGQDHALDFTKGCYIGQEIVERIRSRGAVRRKFAGFIVREGRSPQTGAKLLSDGKEVGVLTSVAARPLTRTRRAAFWPSAIFVRKHSNATLPSPSKAASPNPTACPSPTIARNNHAQ